MRTTASAIVLVILAPQLVAQVADSARAAESKRSLSYALYRSVDNGASWSVVGAGLTGTVRINALAVAGEVAFAGTDEGLFTSNDGGRSWSARVVTPSPRVRCLVVEGQSVYAAASSMGVLVTKDGGRFWKRAGQGLDGMDVRSLATRGGTDYAGTDSKGVFVLPEGGRAWIPFGRGLPVGSQVFDLAVKRRHLYAALYSKGLYRIDAEGRRWEKVGDVRPLEFLVRGEALVAGHNPGGIYQSSDDGATWTHAEGLPGDPPIWVLGEAGPHIIAGTTPGAVVRSIDFGVSWTQSAAGLPPGSAVVAVGNGDDYALVAIVMTTGGK